MSWTLCESFWRWVIFLYDGVDILVVTTLSIDELDLGAIVFFDDRGGNIEIETIKLWYHSDCHP